MEEMFEAEKRLRNGKAAGSNRIIPEMFKAACKFKTQKLPVGSGPLCLERREGPSAVVRYYPGTSLQER